jgi:hypothetical protein
MTAAARAGLTVLPTLVGTPPWATDPATQWIPGMFPPADVADFGRFAAAAAARYGPGGAFWAAHPSLPASPVRAWQIWNEPNLGAFWRPAPDPVAYTRLLEAGSSAIRAVDRGAEIVLAGLPDSLGGSPPAQFLAGIYGAGGAAAFDTLAAHPYAADAGTMVATARRLRDVADRLGHAATPLRVTEFGWASAGEPSLFTSDEATQAALVREGIVALRAAERALNLRGFVYFKWRDHPAPVAARDIWPYHSGLLRPDGSAKPALAAFSAGLVAPLPAATAPAAPLRLRARVPRQRASRVARRGLRVRARCSLACDLRLVVALEIGGVRRVRRVVGRRTRSLPAARDRIVTVKLRRADVRRARARSARLVVRASATAGGQATAGKPVRLRSSSKSFAAYRP